MYIFGRENCDRCGKTVKIQSDEHVRWYSTYCEKCQILAYKIADAQDALNKAIWEGFNWYKEMDKK